MKARSFDAQGEKTHNLEKSDKDVGTAWSWRQGSNLRPAVYKTAALPTELRQLEEKHEAHHIKA